MEMVELTCKNHTHLRWTVKDIAWSKREDGSGWYNGQRNIHYLGTKDGKYEPECSCKASDLMEVKKEESMF